MPEDKLHKLFCFVNGALLQRRLLSQCLSTQLSLRHQPSPSMFLPLSAGGELGLPIRCFTGFAQGPPLGGHHTDEKMEIWGGGVSYLLGSHELTVCLMSSPGLLATWLSCL